nr:MAG TPA: hypothetical protein [Caudoviricetes sp.]
MKIIIKFVFILPILCIFIMCARYRDVSSQSQLIHC